MASTYRSVYKRFNGIDWDIHHFASVTSQVASDAPTRRYVTDDILSWISAWYNDVSGNDNLLDALNLKAPKNNPTFTGNVNATRVVTDDIYTDAIASDTGSISFTGGLDYVSFGGALLKNIGTPLLGTDAATKSYVDAVALGVLKPKASVRVATSSNIVLSGLQTIEGSSLNSGDRVLVKNQTTSSENGIYTVASGSWTKVTNDSERGALVFVSEGGAYAQTFWTNSEDQLDWQEFANIIEYNVAEEGGLDKIGNSFKIETEGVTNNMLAGGISDSKLANLNIEYFNPPWDTAWSGFPAENDASLAHHLGNLYAAIKYARGTNAYNTNNNETVAGAYILANTKNRTYQGSSEPGTSGYVNGDVYLKTT